MPLLALKIKNGILVMISLQIVSLWFQVFSALLKYTNSEHATIAQAPLEVEIPFLWCNSDIHWPVVLIIKETCFPAL